MSDALSDIRKMGKIRSQYSQIEFEKAIAKAREEGAKAEREKLMKSLQKCLDNPDTHEGCDFGTVSVAKIVIWMSAQGYDCD